MIYVFYEALLKIYMKTCLMYTLNIQNFCSLYLNEVGEERREYGYFLFLDQSICYLEVVSILNPLRIWNYLKGFKVP